MLEQIIEQVYERTWVIRLSKLQEIMGVIDRKLAGIQANPGTLEMMAARQREAGKPRVTGAVGILPIVGTIAQRVSMLDEASGGISTEAISAQFDAMLNSEEVGSIVADIDSPGGTYAGIPELAAKIMAARGVKPLVAQVNAYAGSGAYWLAAHFDEVVITPSGDVGSIGAYRAHTDRSVQNEMVGETRTYISYGKYKVEGNPDEPLTDEALAYHQGEVNRVGLEFERSIAKARGVTLAKVQEDWGQGRDLHAGDAVAAGMADSIGTLDETIRRLASGRRSSSRHRVENAKRMLQI